MASMYEIEKNVADLMDQINKINTMLGIDTTPEQSPTEEIVTDPDA